MLKEFQEFIARGNVMDLAVGIIIGAAFTGIVNSVVNDLIMPIFGAIGGFASEGEARVCPKCDGALRHLGTDHEVVGEQFGCAA